MSKQQKPLTIGVINPYALTEVLLKKRVNWSRLTKPQNLIAKTLGHPYEELFDPKHGSPLYAGVELDGETKEKINHEAKNKLSKSRTASMAVSAGFNWIDPGDFFEEGTELTDPVQGALGDCYFIAALSSVAWARPFEIAQRNRTTGPNQQDFVDMIPLFGNGKWTKVEVSERMPMNPPNNTYVYARSSETGEIWPAVYEKAFAKWRTNNSSDQPDYNPIAGGDPVGAMQTLTGLTPVYMGNSALTANDIWQKIRSNCISKKTFNPMVAWTYGSAPSSKVNYNNAHLVANHAYSILGWEYVNNQEYIVLRNPWGSYEAVLNIINGTWMAWDQPYYGGKGYWKSIQMSKVDGVFGLRSDTFKDYFAGFGWVKTPEAP